MNWEIPSAEFGYLIDAKARGAGLAREMAQAVLAQLDRLGFRRISVRVLPDNEPSLRLARSLGFENEGLHRAEYLTGKRPVSDILHLSRIKT